jgi:hypothetical protein
MHFNCRNSSSEFYVSAVGFFITCTAVLSVDKLVLPTSADVRQVMAHIPAPPPPASESTAHTNLFLQERELTSTTTRKCSNIWGSNSTENVRNYGQTTTDWFTIRMHWHMLLCKCNFCLLNVAVVPQLPYSADIAPCDLFLLLRRKIHLHGWMSGCHWNSVTITNCPTWYQKDQIKCCPQQWQNH